MRFIRKVLLHVRQKPVGRSFRALYWRPGVVYRVCDLPSALLPWPTTASTPITASQTGVMSMRSVVPGHWTSFESYTSSLKPGDCCIGGLASDADSRSQAVLHQYDLAGNIALDVRDPVAGPWPPSVESRSDFMCVYAMSEQPFSNVAQHVSAVLPRCIMNLNVQFTSRTVDQESRG